MEVKQFTKGSMVEVSSDDEGFSGAWYVATVVDIVEVSPTKEKASDKKNQDKKIVGYKYLVRYATLFDQKNQAEPLTETAHSSYVRPVPPHNPRRSDDIQAETEEGGAEFQLYDVVDAYHRDGWWIGVVYKVIGDGDGEMKKYLVSFETPPEEFEFEGSELRLHVDWVDSLWKLPPQKTPNQESTDKNVTLTSDSNSESKNGAHSDTPSSKRASRTVSRSRLSAKNKTYSSTNAVTNAKYNAVIGRNETSKGNTEEVVSVMMETSGNEAQAKHQDSLILEQKTTIEETYETQAGNNQPKRKRGRPSKSQSQVPNGSLEENPCINNSHEHDVAPNSTLVNDSQTTEKQYVWPFVKNSPFWATIESQEVYQNLSQNPHFSPLREAKEERREGLAIAHMVTFANLVERIKNLKWTDAIDNNLETLVELEANAFDVGPLRARLEELLAKKSEAGRLEGEMKEAEKEEGKCYSEKMAIEKDIEGLQRKIREMEFQMERAATAKHVKDEEILLVGSRLQGVSKGIVDLKVAFEKLLRSPL